MGNYRFNVGRGAGRRTVVRYARAMLYCLVVASGVFATPAAADINSDDSDGWHTWQIDAAGVLTASCCLSIRDGNVRQHGCNLDGRYWAFNGDHECAVRAGAAQIYVRLVHGMAEDIRVLSSNCPIATKSAVTDHGLVTAGDSLSWFRGIIENRNLDHSLREDALLALVVSGSDAAYEYLDRLLAAK